MEKLWTISRGPIEANEFDLKRAEAINVLLLRPIGILPGKTGDPIKPFAVGLWNDIRALLRPEVSQTMLRRATAAYTHSKRYLFASAQPDAKRHDLDGEPVSEMLPEHRNAAQSQFLRLKGSDTGATVATPAKSPEPEPTTKAEKIRAGFLPRKDRLGSA